jgi:translation elongation factor P/translation initiation factor 5A
VRIYTKGVPGGTVVQTVKMTATVTAIDQAKRTATLQASDGKTFPVKVGPEAVNFDQVRVGDQVTATLTEKVVISLDDKEAPANEGAAAVVARAPKGGQPGGLVAGTTQVTAKIIAIDLEKRTATLQFDDGITQTFPVRADVDLSHHTVGERLVFRVTEAIAIWVEKPQ